MATQAWPGTPVEDAEPAAIEWPGQPEGKRKRGKAGETDAAPVLTGEAIDGDTLRLTSGNSLRLFGADAPELKQQGWDREGNPVPIGANALAGLQTISKPNALIGDIQGESYGRPVAPVTGDVGDYGRSQIVSGNALAAPSFMANDPARRFDYLQQERLARQNRRGMHGTFAQTPEDFRHDPMPVAPREDVARFWDTPTPWAGMRPEIEQQALEMVYDPSVPLEQVDAFMQEKGGSRLDIESAKAAREYAAKTGKRPGFQYRDAPRVLTDAGDGMTGAVSRGFANGVLPNMLEEFGAGADTLGATQGRESVWNSDRRLADIFANNLDQNEAITGYDRNEYPNAVLASEVAGGLVVPIGRVRTAADLAKFGAGYGAVAGFGQSGTIPERMTSGVVGAGEGLVTTVLGGKALEAAAPLLTKGWRWVRGKDGPTLVPPASEAAEGAGGGNPLRQESGAGSANESPSASEPKLATESYSKANGQDGQAMAGEPGASVSQEARAPDYLFASRPSRMDAPLSDAQIRAADIQPGDVVPIPSNVVGSVDEAAAVEAGRFAPAKAPNERDELTKQTVRAWNGAEVPKVGPIDLVGYLRLNGGLRDQAGELAHTGLTNKARTGQDFVGQETRFGPLVNNDNGMNLDDAAFRAWEAGYFPDHTERPDVNTFLDALRGTHEGWGRRFLPDDFAQVDRFNAARDQRHDLDRLRSEVGQVWDDKSVPAGPDMPFAPPQAYEEWPAGGPDFAGNINLGKLDSPQDISRALSQVNNRVGGFDAATRGRVAQAETERLASDLGMTPDALLSRRKGQALNAEEALAARQILAKSANELVNAAKRIKSMDEPGDDILAEFQRKLARHVAIQEQVSGMTAEAGRALQQFRMMADSKAVNANVLTAIVNRGGGKRSTLEAAETLLDAVESGPGVFNALAQAATKPKLRDKLVELWVNSLLSGPQTHVVNMASNTLTSLGQIPEHLAAAAFGAPRRALSRLQGRNSDAVTMTEVGARTFGLMQGAKEGLRLFAQSVKTGEASDLVTKVEGQGMKAISGVKGEIIRIPTRFLTAEDELFKGIARRMELNGEAVRIARKEGLRGEAAKQRVAELSEVPTAAMLERSMDYARYVTFQRKLGPAASKISGLTQDIPALKLFLPFVRTPTNLLKFAVERSPAAPMLKQWRADFVAGGARRDLAVARAALGTGLGMVIYDLALQGKVTGTAPTDPAKARLMYADGFQPYSIRIGDKWYSYKRLDPFSTTLGVAADMALLPEGMSNRQREEQTTLLVASIMGNLANKTWLSGVSDIVGTIEDPERNADRMMQRLAGSLAVPTGVAQVARTMDATARNSDTMGEAIQARIPGASKSLLPRRDVWGREVTSEGGIGPDIISPVYASTAKDDPVSRELLKAGVTVSPPMKKVGGVELTPEQYDQYHAKSGAMGYESVSQLVRSEKWSTLDDEGKQDAVTNIMKAARASAAAEVMGKRSTSSEWPGQAVGGKSAEQWPGQALEQPDVMGDLERIIPGVGITSGFRSKAYQDDMRRRGYKPADNSAHLDGSALDLVPPRGKSMGWLKAQVRRYRKDAVLLDEGDHLHTIFPDWYGAPAIGGAKAAGLVNPVGH